MSPIESNMLFADRYRLIKRIGRGGFAEVWLADDILADLQVAIKIYDGMDEDGMKIFVKEINKVYHLNHTNLLKPQHVAAWNNMPYLVMTYCSAGSLEKKIGQITEQEAWKILHDVASGLAYLHSNNIIHQDIKPANILQDDMGNFVIIDFGISTLARDTLRKSTLRRNTSAGTLAYMGPERFSKDSAPIFASDIWSLGAMLYELLEGVTPFPADFGGGMQKAGAELPDISANVSNELKLVISKMLSLNTWDRPTADTLVEWAKNPSSIKKPTRYTQRKINKIPSSKPWVWIVFGLLVAMGIGVSGIRQYKQHLIIAEQEQRYQDSIRQVQIQDSIHEVLRQDSIRIEQERIRRQDSIAAVQAAEKERREQQRRNELARQVYVDLGLPSGTLWRNANEGGDFARYTYDEAVSKFGNKLPTKKQFEELINKCKWLRNGKGYTVIGPNNNSIFLPAAGLRRCDGVVLEVGTDGYYWSSTPFDSDDAYFLYFFNTGWVNTATGGCCGGQSVRLVQ